MQPIKTIQKTINYLENSKTPFIYFILTFFFIVTIRYFLETISDTDGGEISLELILHFNLSFIALAMVIILLFHLLTKVEIKKISKVILPSFIIILLPPILDLILSKGKGFNIAYLIPGTHDNLILRFFTFFGEFSGFGITPGMKIEIGLILFAAFVYFYIKVRNITKSLVFTFFYYTLLFVLATTPFLIKSMLSIFGITYRYSETLFSNFFLVLILLTGIPLAYLTNKKNFMTILKDINFLRLGHFQLMFIIGIIFGLTKSKFILNEINIFYFIFLPISILSAIIFSTIINNIEDYKIDKILKKNRSLINTNVTVEQYRKLSWPFLYIAIIFSIFVNIESFFSITLCISLSFLHSAYPFRLKRIPLLSKLLISTISLILVMLGFSLVAAPISHFPKPLIAIILISFTLVINFRDIKDYKGDMEAGIKTIPVIFGLKKSKLIIGTLFILAYLSVYLIVKEAYFMILFLIFGLIQFYLINKKNYNEKPVYFVYFISLIILAVYLILYTM